MLCRKPAFLNGEDGFEVQVDSRRLTSYTAEILVQHLSGQCGTLGGQSGTGTRFSPSALVFLRQYNSAHAACSSIVHSILSSLLPSVLHYRPHLFSVTEGRYVEQNLNRWE